MKDLPSSSITLGEWAKKGLFNVALMVKEKEGTFFRDGSHPSMQ